MHNTATGGAPPLTFSPRRLHFSTTTTTTTTISLPISILCFAGLYPSLAIDYFLSPLPTVIPLFSSTVKQRIKRKPTKRVARQGFLICSRTSYSLWRTYKLID